MQELTVELDKIIVNEQARKHFDESDLRAFGANILEHGLLNALLVKRQGERFALVAGERRLRAMKLVGITKCRVIVLKDMDAGDTEVVQWIENDQRADLLPIEKANALQSILKKKGWTNKQAAEHLHMDPSLVTRYLSLFSTSPAVRQAAAEGKIGPAAWYQLSLLPESEQGGLLALHLSGSWSVAQLGEISRKKRQVRPTGDTVRVGRIKCEVPGKKATVVVSGESISLEDMIDALVELTRLARKESEKGLDAKTFERVCRDLAKKN